MNWIEAHRRSEQLANLAHDARREGNKEKAKSLFRQAAEAENTALEAIDGGRPRTLGITAVSATALFYKAGELIRAEQTALKAMALPELPQFAYEQLQNLVQSVWNERVQKKAGVAFSPGQVVVSVKGGQVVTGGAPLDLIVSKVQVIQSLYYRTAEYLMHAPLRIKGPPSKLIAERYRPWLFQTVPGSYQFIVAVQDQAQGELFDSGEPEPEELTDKFLSILRASTEDDLSELETLVPTPEYRTTFLKLTRSLAPSGGSFESIDIRSSSESHSRIIIDSAARKQISQQLKPKLLAPPDNLDKELSGTLRAVDLDSRWLQLTTESGEGIRVNGVSDVVDDVIGPMVNKAVVVQVKEGKRGRFTFQDIDLAD